MNLIVALSAYGVARGNLYIEVEDTVREESHRF